MHSQEVSEEMELGDCRLCAHAIGYHHAGTELQMLCTVNRCSCPGYDDKALPLTDRLNGNFPADTSEKRKGG